MPPLFNPSFVKETSFFPSAGSLAAIVIPSLLIVVVFPSPSFSVTSLNSGFSEIPMETVPLPPLFSYLVTIFFPTNFVSVPALTNSFSADLTNKELPNCWVVGVVVLSAPYFRPSFILPTVFSIASTMVVGTSSLFPSTFFKAVKVGLLNPIPSAFGVNPKISVPNL